MSRMDELQEIQGEIVGVFRRERCTLYEARVIIIQLTEQIRTLALGKDPYKIHLGQDHNQVELVIFEVQGNDIVADSIQKIVNEILEDIGDIFIREKLFKHECKMVLSALEEKIKKSSQNKRQ